MSTSPSCTPGGIGASGSSRGESRSADSRETRVLFEALGDEMKRGEETSLALLSSLSVDQMCRQLDGTARGLYDVALTHLARLPREVAMRALEDSLDAHRNRVRPSLHEASNLNLFGRLTQERSS